MTNVIDADDIVRKLQPDSVRGTLLRASLFLSAWELIKSDVEEGVKAFFRIGFDENGWTYDGYEERVLSKHKSRFRASVMWLTEAGALTDQQADRLHELRDYRNTVAHELPSLLTMPGQDVSHDRLVEARDLLAALGRFWGRLAVDMDPSFDNAEVDDAGIKSGAMLLMEHLLEVAALGGPATLPESDATAR